MNQQQSAQQPQEPAQYDNSLFTERNNYFTGKYMTAHDFRAEQKFFMSHDRWHQWTLHGWGIVWGLEVSAEKNGNDTCITIKSGTATDCQGRELVLPYDITFSKQKLDDQNDHKDCGKSDDILIGLRYRERPKDSVHLLLNDPCDEPPPKRNNHIVSYAKIVTVPYDMNCWRYPHSYEPMQLPEFKDAEGSKLASACDDLAKHNSADECECSCAQPRYRVEGPCDCGECGFVPLARLEKKNGAWTVDQSQRRYVRSPYYGEALTHIVGINWYHSAQTPFSSIVEVSKRHSPKGYLKDRYDRMVTECKEKLGQITIAFDKPLATPPIEGPTACSIVNSSVYFSQLIRLQYSVIGDGNDSDGDDPPQVITELLVHLTDCRKKMHIHFPAHPVERKLPVRMRLWLDCDMLLDECERPVDGDHLSGKVKYLDDACSREDATRTGDGLEGGTFYTWTDLTPPSR